jgi:hypothetical protein
VSSEYSPALRQGSPGVTRLRGAGLTLHRQGKSSPSLHVRLRSPGPLPATIASPNWVRFLAAFTSRTRTRPHIVQTYVRSDRAASLAFTAPHSEQVLLDGNHLSTTTVRPPLHVVLYSNCRRICPNEASGDMPGKAVVSDHPRHVRLPRSSKTSRGRCRRTGSRSTRHPFKIGCCVPSAPPGHRRHHLEATFQPPASKSQHPVLWKLSRPARPAVRQASTLLGSTCVSSPYCETWYSQSYFWL